jgi:hypothetical protein
MQFISILTIIIISITCSLVSASKVKELRIKIGDTLERYFTFGHFIIHEYRFVD